MASSLGTVAFTWVTVMTLWTPESHASILQTMQGKGVINKFTSLLLTDRQARSLLDHPVTVFAPSDDALKRFKGQKDTRFLLNHIVNVPLTIGETNEYQEVLTVPSLAPGGPPLYIAKKGVEYYVNGAQIIMRNLQPLGGLQQRLHIIDRVLEPLVPDGELADKNTDLAVGLSARKLLRRAEYFDLKGQSIRRFADRVIALGNESLFDTTSESTFFMPVDDAFENLSVMLVTTDIIKGHIVPGKLMFTRPESSREEKTLTFNSKDGIQITTVIQNTNNKPQVKSITAKGSLENPRGEHVIANIIHANIPVANGVVHLIDRPLVIVASSLWEYIQEEARGQRIRRFADYLLGHDDPKLQDAIKNCKECTLFAPSDEAFTSDVSETLRDKEKAKEILGLHFVDKRISGDDVRVKNPQNGFQMYDVNVPYPPGSRNKVWLYFKKDDNLFISGKGVSAEVTIGDIGATNGVIHIIDKVLGVPSSSVYDIVSSDPMMDSTFSLGEQDHFNDQLKNKENYTFLVPSNQAWEKIQHDFASAYKQLFMGSFAYQSNSMLEKHFKIGEALSVEELLERTESKGGVQMLRGNPLKFYKETSENGEQVLYVMWENIRANVVRSDLKCTNGYIHVIDTVLMKRRDVTVSAAGNVTIRVTYLVSGFLIALILAPNRL